MRSFDLESEHPIAIAVVNFEAATISQPFVSVRVDVCPSPQRVSKIKGWK